MLYQEYLHWLVSVANQETLCSSEAVAAVVTGGEGP